MATTALRTFSFHLTIFCASTHGILLIDHGLWCSWQRHSGPVLVPCISKFPVSKTTFSSGAYTKTGGEGKHRNSLHIVFGNCTIY